MHGHGAKPHLCKYEECDRALPGNGFPRRYNLYDHMKRVHDYKPELSPEASPTLTTERIDKPHGGRSAIRKRKATSSIEDVQGRRQRTMPTPRPVMQVATPSQQARRAQHERQLADAQWMQQRDQLKEQLQSMSGPQDVPSLAAHFANLQRLVEKSI